MGQTTLSFSTKFIELIPAIIMGAACQTKRFFQKSLNDVIEDQILLNCIFTYEGIQKVVKPQIVIDLIYTSYT